MDLTAALKQLGIRSIFDADKVDFSVSQMFYSVVFTDTFQPILGRQPAEVGEIKHAVELEVDEHGIEGLILK